MVLEEKQQVSLYLSACLCLSVAGTTQQSNTPSLQSELCKWKIQAPQPVSFNKPTTPFCFVGLILWS